MSKRNFILLIIVLIIIITVAFWFFYFRQPAGTPLEDTGGTNFISMFNPFGKSTPTPPAITPSTDTEEEVPISGEEIPKTKLAKISSMPIAGYGIYKKERLKDVPIPPIVAEGETPPKTVVKPVSPPTEFVTALRYVERATGNIYQTFADKIDERKFSATVIPKVYEAYFGNGALSVIMRYLKTDDKTIETFVANLPKELLGGDTTSDSQIKGSFLPTNVSDLSLSPDAKKIFYLFNLGDSAVGTTLNLSDNKKVQVFSSPFTEWLSFWPKSEVITLTTKPSSGVPGYMYIIDTTKKNLSKVLGEINGLTTLTSPNSKLVLYGDNNLSLYLYHTDSRNSDPLAIKTLPEKCVWGGGNDIVYCAVPKFLNPGGYPDAWYQGKVSFNDQIWKINILNGDTTMVGDPTLTTGEEVDGIKLSIDESGNYLFFINKKDSFLWKLELK